MRGKSGINKNRRKANMRQIKLPDAPIGAHRNPKNFDLFIKSERVANKLRFPKVYYPSFYLTELPHILPPGEYEIYGKKLEIYPPDHKTHIARFVDSASRDLPDNFRSLSQVEKEWINNNPATVIVEILKPEGIFERHPKIVVNATQVKSMNNPKIERIGKLNKKLDEKTLAKSRKDLDIALKHPTRHEREPVTSNPIGMEHFWSLSGEYDYDRCTDWMKSKVGDGIEGLTLGLRMQTQDFIKRALRLEEDPTPPLTKAFFRMHPEFIDEFPGVFNSEAQSGRQKNPLIEP